MGTKTKQDAFARIKQAQFGAHVDATDEYLGELACQLHLWLESIRMEFAVRVEAERRLAAEEA